MRIDQLWQELTAEAAGGTRMKGGWLLRLAFPMPALDLFVGLEVGSGRRSVLLKLPKECVPSRRQWPRCKGLEAIAIEIDGAPHFGVCLRESRYADVFSAITEDLCRRIGSAASPNNRVEIFIGQLGRWQKFLSAAMEGLSSEEQRGLWGELYFLKTHLLPVTGAAGVHCWKGADRAAQDFVLGSMAVEIKTTMAKRPQVVRISSERQLDASGWSTLILNAIAIEDRDNGGSSIPAIVNQIRELLRTNTLCSETFEEKLLQYGYLDVHSPRYEGHGYIARADELYEVRPGFPCIVEAELPAGVGDVNYGLSLSACTSYLVAPKAFRKKLSDMIDEPQKKENQ